MKKMKVGKDKVRSVAENDRGPCTGEVFGFLAREFKIIGDIESPVFPAKPWKRIKK